VALLLQQLLCAFAMLPTFLKLMLWRHADAGGLSSAHVRL
jgi:hypothetical protein